MFGLFMSEHTPPGETGLPRAHAACALLCFGGALVTCADWPRPSPQHGDLLVLALLVWSVSTLYQFLLAAGHLRTSILDHQRLFSSSRYERSSDLGWIVANVVVLVVVALFYALREESIPLLTGQTTTLVSLLATSVISLVIWALRRSITPKRASAEEPAP